MIMIKAGGKVMIMIRVGGKVMIMNRVGGKFMIMIRIEPYNHPFQLWVRHRTYGIDFFTRSATV